MSSSLQRRDAKTAQYLGWKSDAEDYDSRLRLQLIAQLSYLLDDATLQKAPLWQLRAWTANGTAFVKQPTLAERVEKLRAVFDKADAIVGVEPAQPVVELDEQAVAEYQNAYRASYADTFGGDNYEFADVNNGDFDSDENFIYRTVR